MMTYYFDIIMNGSHSADMVGYTFRSPVLARIEATKIAAELLFDQPLDVDFSGFHIRIINGLGRVVSGFVILGNPKTLQ